MKSSIKEIVDRLLALILLILTGPLILLAMLASFMAHRANPIFFQRRVGYQGSDFSIFKIRTMRHIPDFQLSVTTRNDPRVTTIGGLLRKTKLDELPQIINVLLGSMSFVGPRPTVREDIDRMDEKQLKRLKVKPGITGLAQINGNTELTWPERIRLDLEYVENFSIWLDIKILVKTFLLVLSNQAETHPLTDDEWEEPTP